MLSCVGKEVECDSLSDAPPEETCGNDVAYFYFISFYMLCSFLVSHVHLLMDTHSLQKLDSSAKASPTGSGLGLSLLFVKVN